MHIFKKINEYRSWREALSCNEKVGFIPTMGALHAGHESLIKAGVKENKHAVVSIFVNALQFNAQSDLASYPRQLEQDLGICQRLGANVVFAPEHGEMYKPDHSTFCQVENLDQYLCGAARPGHFRGVCTVVLKLLNIIFPSAAYFGQKDFQQARIIQHMVQDLNMNVNISIMPTVREPSGLALSSRNLRLTPRVQERACAIFRGLSKAHKMYTDGETDSSVLERVAREEIDASSPDSIDYLTVVAQKTLHPVSRVKDPAVLTTAVFYDGVRLIDNILLQPL